MATRRLMPPESSAGNSFDGVLQFHEAQRLQHAALNLFLRNLFLVQAKGDVVFHRQRVEERRLLKDHSDAAAQFEQFRLAHRRHFLPQHKDASAIGTQQSEREFQDGGLAGAGDSQQHLGGAVFQFEGEAVEDDLLIEAQADIFKDYGLRPSRCGWPRSSSIDGPSSTISRRVTNRSTARMSTLAATTAWVVARPTPCVPPLALSP